MATKKISELTALTSPATGDLIQIVDISETSSVKNKKITYSELLASAPDGTAAAPTFSFEADSGGTGMYRSATNQLSFSTGGTERLQIQADGDVIVNGNLSVLGTQFIVEVEEYKIKDKNIEMAVVNTPTDNSADGGGLTLKGATDKTWNWVNATDAWTSSEHIHVGDNKKLLVGTGSDLQIFHDGTNSGIQNTGGGLFLTTSTSGIYLRKDATEELARFHVDANNEFYYDNSKKLETTSTGIDVSGLLVVDQDWISDTGSINIESSANVLSGIGFRSNNTYTGGFIYRDGTAGNFFEINSIK